MVLDFPSGTVVKRICLLRQETWIQSGKIPRAVGQISPCATTTEACVPRACGWQQEKPHVRSSPHTKLESSPLEHL